MSHFLTMIIGDDPEKQLAPFDENLDVPEYYSEDVSEKDKQGMMAYYSNGSFPFSDFEECYKYYGQDWNGNSWKKCDDGIWRVSTTYNPNSKWDWYLLGGRWSGRILKLKPEATSGIIGEPSWCSKSKGIDAARKGEIDLEAMKKKDISLVPYAYIKDGEWHSKGEMGWWGISTNNKPQEEWDEHFWNMFNSLPDDTMIWLYDLHI